MLLVLFALYLATSLILPTLAVTVFTSPNDLKTSAYDFVVVGGGTAVGR